jgi:hypothetical protein
MSGRFGKTVNYLPQLAIEPRLTRLACSPVSVLNTLPLPQVNFLINTDSISKAFLIKYIDRVAILIAVPTASHTIFITRLPIMERLQMNLHEGLCYILREQYRSEVSN